MTRQSDTSMHASEVVAADMGDVLLRPPLAASDDFFLCGGDSIRAVELISRLVARYDTAGGERSERLRSALLLAVFEEATPAALGETIDAHLR